MRKRVNGSKSTPSSYYDSLIGSQDRVVVLNGRTIPGNDTVREHEQSLDTGCHLSADVHKDDGREVDNPWVTISLCSGLGTGIRVSKTITVSAFWKLIDEVLEPGGGGFDGVADLAARLPEQPKKRSANPSSSEEAHHEALGKELLGKLTERPKQ